MTLWSDLKPSLKVDEGAVGNPAFLIDHFRGFLAICPSLILLDIASILCGVDRA